MHASPSHQQCKSWQILRVYERQSARSVRAARLAIAFAAFHGQWTDRYLFFRSILSGTDEHAALHSFYQHGDVIRPIAPLTVHYYVIAQQNASQARKPYCSPRLVLHQTRL